MARVKRIKEEKGGDWQTIFLSLSIILVAFFVMLCSYATLETGKIIEVRRSFSAALDLFPSGVLFEKGSGVTVPSPDTSGQAARKIAAPIYQFLKGKGLEEQINLKSTSKYVSITLLDSLLFEESSAELTADARTLLSNLSRIMSAFSLPVRIEGHTDDRFVSSAVFSSQWELSAMRAVNVMRFIQDTGAIKPELISCAGFAQYRPFVPNKTDDDRARNRRVEITIPLVEDFFTQSSILMQEAPPSFKVWDLTG